MSKNLRAPHQILILILSESTRITKLLLTPKINRKTGSLVISGGTEVN